MEGIEQNFDANRREYHGEDEQLLDDYEWWMGRMKGKESVKKGYKTAGRINYDVFVSSSIFKVVFWMSSIWSKFYWKCLIFKSEFRIWFKSFYLHLNE